MNFLNLPDYLCEKLFSFGYTRDNSIMGGLMLFLVVVSLIAAIPTSIYCYFVELPATLPLYFVLLFVMMFFITSITFIRENITKLFKKDTEC